MSSMVVRLFFFQWLYNTQIVSASLFSSPDPFLFSSCFSSNCLVFKSPLHKTLIIMSPNCSFPFLLPTLSRMFFFKFYSVKEYRGSEFVHLRLVGRMKHVFVATAVLKRYQYSFESGRTLSHNFKCQPYLAEVINSFLPSHLAKR